MARDLPPLPAPDVPMFGADRNMSPTWRQFWVNLMLYISGVQLAQSTSYANDAAAAAGGVKIGQFYRDGSVVKVRVS